jgi:beta-galactosidase
LELSNGINGVRVEAVNMPFGFNAWPYPQSALEGPTHQWQIKKGDEITINIDAAQMGVGGDNSWGARPHDNRMLGAGTYRLVFKVKGLNIE